MKKIVIIGGGISGSALLHYLKQRHEGAEIVLLEKNNYLGGTIRSLKKGGCLFETGPNGFLDSKPRTREFIKKIGLEDSLIRADDVSKVRYISIGNVLHPLPTNPKSFLFSRLLNPLEKIRVLGEFFTPRGDNPAESVYDFGRRRIGERFAQVFLDPMVSGVFGGDARKTNLKAAFPRIHDLEQEYGSLFAAMMKIRKAKKAEERSKDKTIGSPTGTLTSFQGGMAQVIDTIGESYKEHIRLGVEVGSISCEQDRYSVICQDGQNYIADELFICAPAYNTGPMLKNINEAIPRALEKIYYAPIVVLGLVFPSEYLKDKPKGYGYLIPSSEQKEVLGVLFESDIFPGRCRKDQVLLRIMIGGARNPGVLNKTQEELIDLALEEIKPLIGEKSGKDGLEELFFTRWEKAIPQYDNIYCDTLKEIKSHLAQRSNLHLVANYLNGVSINDCIESAYQAAQTVEII